MQQYIDLMNRIMRDGVDRPDRTGTGTRSVFGAHLNFDLREGFPAVTTKKLNFHAIVTELLWFLRGGKDLSFLHDHGVKIWDQWADEDGCLGPVYGAQWRDWRTYNPLRVGDRDGDHWRRGPGVDQVAQLLKTAREKPYDRRLLVSAWNVADLNVMALPPCHVLWQIYLCETPAAVGDRTLKWRWLDLQMYQRSADVFVGLPFDIASYAVLQTMLARVLGYAPRHLIVNLGDTHLYHDHIEEGAVAKQLEREPRPLPRLVMDSATREYLRSEQAGHGDFTGLHPGGFKLDGYDPHPWIKVKVSV